jgi:hypothetical protein
MDGHTQVFLLVGLIWAVTLVVGVIMYPKLKARHEALGAILDKGLKDKKENNSSL